MSITLCCRFINQLLQGFINESVPFSLIILQLATCIAPVALIRVSAATVHSQLTSFAVQTTRWIYKLGAFPPVDFVFSEMEKNTAVLNASLQPTKEFVVVGPFVLNQSLSAPYIP